MTARLIAAEIVAAEEAISSAMREHGDEQWRWASSLSNPYVVPIMWNDVLVIGPNGSRVLAAVDYVNEGGRDGGDVVAD